MASSLTVNQQAPSLFLNLPAEVRDRVYYHALDNSIIRTDRPYPLGYDDFGHSRSKSEWPYTGLLLTCNQIHNEASYILYRYGYLQIRVVGPGPKIERPSLFFDIGKRYERHFNLVRNLRIEIDWQDRRRYWDDSSMGFNLNYVFHFIMTTISTLCDAVAKLRHLKTIKIRWPALKGPHWGQRYMKARHEYCRLLLQPFVSCRRGFQS